jgi:hypothetical protein
MVFQQDAAKSIRLEFLLTISRFDLIYFLIQDLKQCIISN